MSVRPGQGLVWLLVVAVLVGMFSFVTPLAEWGVSLILLTAMGCIAADALYIRKTLGRIDVSRSGPDRVPRGKRISFTLNITNNTPKPVLLEYREVVPRNVLPRYLHGKVRVNPGETRHVEYSLQFPIRGEYKIGPSWLRIIGSLGFLEWRFVADVYTNLQSLPESAVVNDELEKKALAELRMLFKESRTRLRGEGLEFESLSEYRGGEEIRKIDWKTSARQNRLIVRRYQVEQHRDLMILLDCGRLMGAETGNGSKLDRAVDSLLMLSRIAIEKGDRCGVGIFDDNVRGYLPPIAGNAAMKAITQCVYNVQPSWRESNFRAMFSVLQTKLLKRSLVVILSDLTDMETSEQLRTAIHSISKRHLVLFVAVRTPELDQLQKTPVQSDYDLTQHAVVMRLLGQRAYTLDAMHGAGVRVLDVEPRKITVPMINQYISIRERNLL